ncbi:MAG: hypothetical protein ABSA53_14215 [Streptosporangiaceae bacterium]
MRTRRVEGHDAIADGAILDTIADLDDRTRGEVPPALQPFAPLAFGLLLTHLHQRTMYVIAALTVLITLYVWRTAGFAHRAAGRLSSLADDHDQD